MREDLKISVIVLTYRNFGNLRKNIESILMQTYQNYEVIIQDDGSDNFDYKKINSYLKDKPQANKFKIYSNEINLGTVKNANLAFGRASGDIVIPLSQDDLFYDSDVLKDIASYFADNSINICQAKMKGCSSRKVFPSVKDINILKYADNNKLWYRMAFSSFISGAVLYWRKSYFESIGTYDESYILLEDYPVLMRIIERGEKIDFFDRITIEYGEDGVSSNHKNPNLLIVKDNVRLYKSLIEKSEYYIHSKLCRDYLKYRLNKWMRFEDGREHFDIKLLEVYLFLAKTKVLSKIRKRDLRDYRFDQLWKKESGVQYHDKY